MRALAILLPVAGCGGSGYVECSIENQVDFRAKDGFAPYICVRGRWELAPGGKEKK